MKKRLLGALLAAALLVQSFTLPVMAAENSILPVEETVVEMNGLTEEAGIEMKDTSAGSPASEENAGSQEETASQVEQEETAETGKGSASEEASVSKDSAAPDSGTYTGETAPSEEKEASTSDSAAKEAVGEKRAESGESSSLEADSVLEDGSVSAADGQEREGLEEDSVSENETESKAAVIQPVQEGDSTVRKGLEDLAGNVIQEGGFTILEAEERRSRTAYFSANTLEDYLLSQLKARKKTINVSAYNLSESSFLSYLSHLINNHPELFAVNLYSSYYYMNSSGKVTRLEMGYYTGYNYNAFYAAVDEAMSLLDDSMSDLEKAAVLHDYVVLNCAYDYDSYERVMANPAYNPPRDIFNAYGVLVNELAVCQGYALAYKLLCNEAGITCHMVTSNNLNHAWNLIRLPDEDGMYQYYQVDTTWDDPRMSYAGEDVPGQVIHDYMFISEVLMEEDHLVSGASKDWRVSEGGSVGTQEATDNCYDSYYWRDADSALVFKGAYCYYIDESGSENAIRKRNRATGAETTLLDFGTVASGWSAGASSSAVFSGLFMEGSRLYFNLGDKLYSIGMNGGEYRAETEGLNNSSGSVYGMYLKDGRINYVLANSAAAYYLGTGYVTQLTLDKTQLLNDFEYAVETVKLSEESLSFPRNETRTLQYEYGPANATIANVEWSVEPFNSGKIAEAEKEDGQTGRITPTDIGHAFIKISITDSAGNTVEDTCTLEVVLPQYTVTFVGEEGGKPVSVQRITEGEAAADPSLTLPEFKALKGRRFIGWDKSFASIMQDTVVTAEYEWINYTITYVLNNGSSNGGNPSAYTMEDAIKLNPAAGGPADTVFAGWYDNAELAGNPLEMIEPGTTGNITLYASWKSIKGLTFKEVLDGQVAGSENTIAAKEYTGSAIKPQLKVYYGTKELTAGREYSLSYRNNLSAGTGTIIIRGKGEYSGTLTTTFEITPGEINLAEIDELAAAYNRGRVIKPIPTVTWKGRKLYNRRDFKVTYVNEDAEGAFREIGKYTVRVEGKGNFTGSKEIELDIVDGASTILMSKVEISNLAVDYSDSIDPAACLELTYNNQPLDSSYYTITAVEGKMVKDIGSYQLVVAGNGTDCVGTRRVTFTVKGKNMVKALVGTIADRTYTGGTVLQPENNEEDRLTITYPGVEQPLIYGRDYTIECDAVKVGLAKVVIRGRGEYYGTLTKIFRLLPAADSKEEKPEIQPDEVKSMSDVMITVPDLAAGTKAGSYRSTPILTDTNGKRLRAGVDYSTDFVYRDGNGTLLDENDVPPAGSEITVEVIGMGDYSGTGKATFRIAPKGKLLSAATVEVREELTYSGGRVTLSKEDLTVTMGNTVLADSDYRIKSLRSNAERGNAVIVLEGMGDYAGTRQVSIKITAQEIVLWEQD